MSAAQHSVVRRFGKIRTHAMAQEHIQQAVRRALETGAPLSVTYANPHNVCIAEDDAEYRSALAAFDVVFPEGEGLARAARRLGYSGYEKFHTTDFWPKLFPAFGEAGARVFLLGSTKDTLRKAKERLSALGLYIAGTADGYTDVDDGGAAVAAIRDSGAKVLLVGMGVPRQEKWLAAHRERLGHVVVLCDGNYLEFAAGTVNRAPRFMRRIGLEWLHRMIVEPRRLWKRYILGIPRFWRIIRRQKKGAG